MCSCQKLEIIQRPWDSHRLPPCRKLSRPEADPVHLKVVTSEEALCHLTVLIKNSPELIWYFLCQVSTMNVDYFLRQRIWHHCLNEALNMNRMKSDADQHSSFFANIAKYGEKSFQEQQQSINKVREELFSGLRNKQWHVIIRLKECHPVICSSSQRRSGPGDLAYFYLEKWHRCQSSTPKTPSRSIQMLGIPSTPWAKIPVRGSNIYPGFPTILTNKVRERPGSSWWKNIWRETLSDHMESF